MKASVLALPGTGTLRRLASMGAALAIVYLCATPDRLAAQQQPPEQPVVDDPAKQEQPVVANDKNTDEPEREQTIYIPYTKLREVFEKDGRGVFLPYDKFQALWKAAREAAVRTPEAKPPVSALVTEIDSEATVAKDVVRVAAKMKIELLGKGWIDVPLGLADAAILSAKVGEEPARLVYDPQQGYKLLVEKTQKSSEQIELALEYAKAFTKAPGQNSVSFQAPQAPVNRWKIRVPESGVKVNIQPLIAATEAPDEKQPGEKQPEKPDEQKKETVVLAFVGASPTVRIDWTPKAEGATGLEALATVQAQQQVTVDEGVLRTHTRLAYDISRAEVSQLTIEVPADQKVVNVFDPNVRQWVVEAQEGGAQKITVQLFQPTRGSQNVIVELEKFTGDAAQKELSVPVVKALGVGRQQGIVVVQLAAGLRGEATKRTGLLQLDAGELPQSLANQNYTFAYRYAALPFDLTLSVEKVKPRILADELVEVYLEPEQLTLDLLVLYTIERAGIFQLELNVPAGYDVRQVRGHGCAGAEAAAVDSHHLEGENKTRLVVNLSRKAMGKVGLFVELQKRLDDPNLLTPTGSSSDLAIDLPRVVPASVERATGRLVVYAPESLRVNPTKTDGLRAVSFNEAYQGTESTRGGRFPALRPVLAYAFTSEPAALAAAVERRKPHVTVAQLLVANIEAGVVKYTATFNYDIRYSGVKSLRIDLPAAVAPDVRNLTAGVREKTIDPAPADVAQGYVAWSFTGETEFLGAVSLQLAWERKLEKLEIGKSIDLEVPVLRPREADRAWGQIVIAKAETIDVGVPGTPTGLRGIDPQHDLMPGASVPNAAMAFEFHDEWSLKLAATRYELEEVKRTSIERAVLRMVATRSDQIAVQALYRMKSVTQRLEVRLPEGVQFDTQPLRINGQPVALEKGDKGGLFVPLAGRTPEEPFLLELRYTTSNTQTRFELPEFPNEPAVQQVFLCAYLPEEQVLLGAQGAWNEEYVWQVISPTRQRAAALKTDSELVSWVSEGLSISGSPMSDFLSDGTMYVYSTLRPKTGADGLLRLITMDEDWLNVLVFAIVAIAGLALVRRSIAGRLAGIVLLVILVVLMGVFLPTLSRQVLDGVFFSAIGLVLLVWVVELIYVLGNRGTQWFAARSRAAAAASALTATPAVVAPPPGTPPTPEASQPAAPAGPASETSPEGTPFAAPPPEEPKPGDQSQGGPSHG